MSQIFAPEKGLTLAILFSDSTVPFGHSFGLSPFLLFFGDSFEIISLIMDMF